ncbi:MAG: 2-amino-4-hydroxy-6-hydroxymethyldihydropteridine diphosphokinase [Candidatus Cloacimonetes bacterium]|nr:2-amino-4-hydroxy-6-hydroxymethyldihydropteridine diphosphokinase [Candidatus Cloacimonadota bacterium]
MIYYLCLGANMENPGQQIDIAIANISLIEQTAILRKSSRINTVAYGYTMQADFVNQVIEVSSNLDPRHLLQKLLAIESAMGRKRGLKWGPRLIDLDILLAENIVMDTTSESPLASETQEPDITALPEITIPHPDLHNRSFALQLLNELVPNMMHPVMHKTISELYYLITNNGGKP